MDKKRNSKEIAADITMVRENLKNTFSILEKYVSPINKPMRKVTRGLGLGGSYFFTAKGNLKFNRVIAAATAGIGLIKIFTRSRKADLDRHFRD